MANLENNSEEQKREYHFHSHGFIIDILKKLIAFYTPDAVYFNRINGSLLYEC